MIYHSNEIKSEVNEERLTHRSSFLLKFFVCISTLWFTLLLLIEFVLNKFWITHIVSFIPPFIYIFVTAILVLITGFIVVKNLRNINTLIKFLVIITFLTLIIGVNLSDLNLNFLNRSKESDYTIFNWNTKFWESEENYNEFLEFLKDKDADIYTLQEFISDPNSNQIENKDKVDFIARLQEDLPEYEIVQVSEFVTLTKFKVFSHSPNSDNYYLRTDVWIEDEIVSIYNVHIPVHADLDFYGNINRFIDNMKTRYVWRDELIESLGEDIARNDKPVIISGDFNTTRAMGMIKSIHRITEDSVRKSNYILNNTWSSERFNFWRIDYVLSRNNIEFTSYKRIDPGNMSDHFGILVGFNLK